MDPVVSSRTEVEVILDCSDKITYTWSDVNVYCTARNTRAWDRFYRRRKPVEQKHILKDGKYKRKKNRFMDLTK